MEELFSQCLAQAKQIVAAYRAEAPRDFDPRADFSPSTPKPRDLGQETRDTIQAQVDLAPQLYEAEAKYRPKYAALERDVFMKTLLGDASEPGLLDTFIEQIQPRLERLGADALARSREADVATVERYGKRAVDAIRDADPSQRDLMNEINRQALDELRLGATLDPSLRREVQQSVRSGQAARGFGFGLNDASEEAFYTALQADQLRRQRQGFAGQVASLNAATRQDPFLAILGRPSQSLAASQSLLGQGVGASAAAAPRLFDPFHPYAAQAYSQQYDADMTRRVIGSQNDAQFYGSLAQGVGAMAGAAMSGGCWVAREVYGADNPRWRVFQDWLYSDAPAWFRALYLRFGQRFARLIRSKPRMKGFVKWWMERRIAGRYYIDGKIYGI